MASTTTATESTPLIQPADNTSTPTPPKPIRTVTFSPHTTVKSINGKGNTSTRTLALSSSPTSSQTASSGPPVLSALQGKLKRRNSGQGTPLPSPTYPTSKIGPQRTTKTAQKLKLLPNPEFGEDGPDQESGRDVYTQFTRIKDPTARRDAARLGKADREKLPRVTAYCTANAYRLDALMRFLKGRGRTRGAAPKLFDECLYTPYRYPSEEDVDRSGWMKSPGRVQMKERRYSDSAIGGASEHHRNRRRHLIDIDHDEEAGDGPFQDGPHSQMNSNSPVERRGQQNPDLDTEVHTPEVFLFNYGTVVIWGMTLQQEQRFLKEISKFEKEKLASEDVQTENFNFYYTTEYQARIYNDFISLSDKKNYMIKLAISHALSQSVKVRISSSLLVSSHLPSPPAFYLTNPHLDIPIRRPRRCDHRNNERHPRTDRTNRQSQSDSPPDSHAGRRTLHPPNQHPPARLRARLTRSHVGRTTTRSRLPGRPSVSGDGSAGETADGEIGCHC